MMDGAKPVELTVRELQCLGLVAQGHRVANIAHALDLAAVTVELHLKHARSKLAARTLPHAIARAIFLGLIGKDDVAVTGQIAIPVEDLATMPGAAFSL